MNMPYSVARAGPEDVDGVGNCKLKPPDCRFGKLTRLDLIKLHSSDP
jgi:hypothetical protein